MWTRCGKIDSTLSIQVTDTYSADGNVMVYILFRVTSPLFIGFDVVYNIFVSPQLKLLTLSYSSTHFERIPATNSIARRWLQDVGPDSGIDVPIF